jgi:SAM-dependent methyltransferase
MNCQIEKDHYYDTNYDNKERFFSYWHQINEILSLDAGEVLEIGKGNGFVSNYLLGRGKKLFLLDIDKGLIPDVVGTVREIPFCSETFDVVACYEVLEHLPYEFFCDVLKELYRVSKSYVILSLPDRSGRAYKFHIQIPMFGELKSLITIPRLKPIEWKFDGQHYWEIGTRGYSIQKINLQIKKSNFLIEKNYRLFDFPYHRFFLLKKH